MTVMSGSLLTPGDVSSAPPIAAGYAVVGLALKQGQLPAAGSVPGDQVMVIQTGAPGSPLGSFVGPSSSPAADGSSPVTGIRTTMGQPREGHLQDPRATPGEDRRECSSPMLWCSTPPAPGFSRRATRPSSSRSSCPTASQRPLLPLPLPVR